MRMSSPPWSASPKPSTSTASPSEVITLSTAALKVAGESTENGVASRAIQSSSVAYVGVGRDMGCPFRYDNVFMRPRSAKRFPYLQTVAIEMAKMRRAVGPVGDGLVDNCASTAYQSRLAWSGCGLPSTKVLSVQP